MSMYLNKKNKVVLITFPLLTVFLQKNIEKCNVMQILIKLFIVRN